jgi:hypothetical protein
MRRGYAVEQIFVRKRGGRFVIEFGLVALSGALKKETLTFGAPSARDALDRAARHLAGRGDVDRVDGLRLRVEQRGELRDDAALKAHFAGRFLDELDETDDF